MDMQTVLVSGKSERVSTKQAALELNMGVDTLQFMMQEGKLPIGYAYKKPGKKRWAYYIYRGLLNEFLDSLNRAADKNLFLYGVPGKKEEV